MPAAGLTVGASSSEVTTAVEMAETSEVKVGVSIVADAKTSLESCRAFANRAEVRMHELMEGGGGAGRLGEIVVLGRVVENTDVWVVETAVGVWVVETAGPRRSKRTAIDLRHNHVESKKNVD